jgi:acyl-CoA thioester hydrolase
MQVDGLLELHRDRVRPEWIDYNGHMNVAYYVLAFDHATDAFLDYLGMGEAYRHDQNASVFTAEAHVTYERELRHGDPLRFQTQLLGYDRKRVHYFHTMYHDQDGYLAATNELMILHVDMAARRVAPMPDAALGVLASLNDRHETLPRPSQVGRVMGLAAGV